MILCHVSTSKALYSLILASRKFYDIFLSGKDYLLAQLAWQLCGHSTSAWNAVAVSRKKDAFTEDFSDDDDDWQAKDMPLEVSSSMIQLGNCVDWLITDFAEERISNSTCFKKSKNFNKNHAPVRSKLSKTETSIIRKAF